MRGEGGLRAIENDFIFRRFCTIACACSSCRSITFVQVFSSNSVIILFSSGVEKHG